jgi:hypothetical protein
VKPDRSTSFKVNTLVIGAGRSGTTSLCDYLEGQESVCFSNIKEVHYFSLEDLHSRGISYYHSFFNHCKGEKIVASADTYLLIDYDAIERIFAYNPEMKLIVLLRDPVERAFSSYNYSVNYGYHEPYPAFLDSIQRESEIEKETNIIRRNNLGHFYGSLYHKHLDKWVTVFGKKQVLVLTTNMLGEEGTSLAPALEAFLGIEFQARDIQRKNELQVPRFRRFEHFLLNRDLPFRAFLRKVVPGKIKRMIIASGVPDQLHAMNRREGSKAKITKEEYDKAMDYFRSDLDALHRSYAIRF